MARRDGFFGFARGSAEADSNSQKRRKQLKAWEFSDTNKQPNTVLPSREVPSVKFGDSVVFLAAVHSGDLEEVERLVRKEGADVNSVNKDGLTALHQVISDEVRSCSCSNVNE